MGDTVKVKCGAQVDEVHYNELINSCNVNISNPVTPVALPLVTMPDVPSFTAGTVDIDVLKNGEETLDAGSYGTFKVRQNGVVTFTGGVYNFEEWDVGLSVDLYFLAPSEIRVNGKLAVDQGSYLGPDPASSGLDATDITIYATGQNGNTGKIGATPKAAKFGINSTIVANVYAPNGTLHIRQGSDATGAFLGKWVVVGQGATVALESGW